MRLAAAYRLPILKRLLPSLHRRAARLLSVNGFALRRSRSAVLLLDVDNYVDRQITLHGDYEPEQQDFLLDRMRALGCDVFVDVGANIGLYSLRIALAGLAPRILAFEPDERNRLQLGANLLLNRLAGRVTVLPQAVSDITGSARFAPAGGGSTGKSRLAQDGGIEVGCVTLDEAVPDSGRRIFVKMDIEGHELAACRGMAGCVARNRVFLQVECFAANLPALRDLLAEQGMRPVRTIRDDHYFANFAAT